MARTPAFVLCHALRGPIHLGGDGGHVEKSSPQDIRAMNIRIVVENVLLFLLPTGIYLGYVLLTRRSSTAGTAINEAPCVSSNT